MEISPEEQLSVGLYRQYPLSRVFHGNPFDQAIASEMCIQDARRVFVLTSQSGADSAHLGRLRTVLGERLAGEYSRIPAHVPIDAVGDAARQAAAVHADHLIAIGGGAVIDAAKAVAYCMGMKTGTDSLRHMHDLKRVDPSQQPAGTADWPRITAIPMTLSAAELSYFAGVTDTARRLKNLIAHPLMTPRAIIYDPRLTLPVRLRVFLASGIKAIDHAAERLAAKLKHPMNDATATHAIKLLAQGLRNVAKAPENLAARLDCQLGAWLSMVGGNAGVRTGASHALGHVLGAHANVEHGLTSCALLPSVMRWNKPANAKDQACISEALGQPGHDAADLIEALIKQLGLPTRLRELGVPVDDLPVIAEKSLHDPGILNNPRTVSGKAGVLEILNMAW